MHVREQYKVVGKVKVLQCIKECPSDSSWLVFCCASHHPLYNQVEKDCRHDISLTYACLDLEVRTAAFHVAGEVVVEALDGKDDAQGNPIISQNAPWTISVDAVEDFLKVTKTAVQLPLPFSALFIDVAQCEDLICAHRFFLKPACSFLVTVSTASEICLAMILARILLGTESIVMPSMLLQSLSAPFFGILMMTPFVQSAGTSSPSHITAKSGCRMEAASSGYALKSSALRLSCPGALPFLRDLIALIISSFPGTAVLMSAASGM